MFRVTVGGPAVIHGIGHFGGLGTALAFQTCRLSAKLRLDRGIDPGPCGFVLDLKRLRTYDFWPIRGFPGRKILCLAGTPSVHRPGHESEGEQYV
jgi:hypothetical protein